MSNNEHTPTPWEVRTTGGLSNIEYIVDANGEEVIFEAQNYAIVLSAHHIVASVNACAGIPTEALEAGVVAELVEALYEMLTTHRGDGIPTVPELSPGWLDARKKAVAALSKARGE